MKRRRAFLWCAASLVLVSVALLTRDEELNQIGGGRIDMHSGRRNPLLLPNDIDGMVLESIRGFDEEPVDLRDRMAKDLHARSIEGGQESIQLWHPDIFGEVVTPRKRHILYCATKGLSMGGVSFRSYQTVAFVYRPANWLELAFYAIKVRVP